MLRSLCPAFSCIICSHNLLQTFVDNQEEMRFFVCCFDFFFRGGGGGEVGNDGGSAQMKISPDLRSQEFGISDSEETQLRLQG